MWLTAQLDLRGWRQADLVRASKLPRDRVSKWVNGHESPTHRNAVIIANTLGVPVEEAVAAAGLDDPVSEPERPGPARALARYSDSDLLSELQLRARAREKRVAAAISSAPVTPGRRLVEVVDGPHGPVTRDEVLRAAALDPGYLPEDAPEPDPA